MSEKSAVGEAPMMLICNLLFDAEPQFTRESIDRAIAGASGAKVANSSDTTVLIAHENDVVTYADGRKVPVLTTIMRGVEVDATRYASALGQTWDWPDARAIVQRARHQLMITEMMAMGLEYHARVRIFFDMLVRLIELTKPLAVHCHHAERVLDPARIIHASGSADATAKLLPFLNVRLFRISNGTTGDLVMDSRGLAALGLPDVQIHFHSLDAKKVAAQLFNIATYLYDNGDCIADGHTVEGLSAEQRWRCQHESALVPPGRIVVDLDPGEPYAAGGRKR